eukprot:4891702-Pleurochrysis_carterae.AAC.1
MTDAGIVWLGRVMPGAGIELKLGVVECCGQLRKRREQAMRLNTRTRPRPVADALSYTRPLPLSILLVCASDCAARAARLNRPPPSGHRFATASRAQQAIQRPRERIGAPEHGRMRSAPLARPSTARRLCTSAARRALRLKDVTVMLRPPRDAAEGRSREWCAQGDIAALLKKAALK